MDSGFLIVRTYDALCARFSMPASDVVYATPQVGVSASLMPKRYRGVDRDALEAWSREELLGGYPYIPTPDPDDQDACVLMYALEQRGAVENDFIFSARDAQAVWAQLNHREPWEVIWVRRVGSTDEAPAHAERLGYEPTWYNGDHFSAVCDAMCFPRWHGPDPDGTLFLPHFNRLNRHALFDCCSDADDFLNCYRSQEWTETGEFVIAEVWSVSMNNMPLDKHKMDRSGVTLEPNPPAHRACSRCSREPAARGRG